MRDIVLGTTKKYPKQKGTRTCLILEYFSFRNSIYIIIFFRASIFSPFKLSSIHARLFVSIGALRKVYRIPILSVLRKKKKKTNRRMCFNVKKMFNLFFSSMWPCIRINTSQFIYSPLVQYWKAESVYFLFFSVYNTSSSIYPSPSQLLSGWLKRGSTAKKTQIHN